MMKPNILLLTDDQHRWDFFDNRTVANLKTPALDRLRAEGTTFTNGFTNCPICMPTRFTWLYGLYAGQAAARLLRNNHDWPTHLPSMAHALQKAGYHTALVGKLHSLAGLTHRDVVEYETETRDRGFDDVFEVCGKSLAYWYDCQWTRHLKSKDLLDAYRGDVRRRIEQLDGHEPYEASFLTAEDSMDGFIGRQAREWLESYDDDKPFFAHMSFCGPHFPFDPPEPYFSHYRPEDMPPPEGPEAPEDIQKWRERRAAYSAMIEQVDDELGKLLDVLDRRGLADNTLVIFGTDHGDMMGHRNRGHKGTPYETSVRTPYILRWPGQVSAGADSPALVEAVDIPCTILDAAGLGSESTEHLPTSPGRSFLPCAVANSPQHRDSVYSEFGTDWRMCRTDEWKYVFRTEEPDELFDLKNDPWEQVNVADNPDNAAILSEMRARLLGCMTPSVAPDTKRE